MEEISVQELKKKFDDKEDFILLDVRTIDEYNTCNIKDSILIPLNELPSRFNELNKNKEIIVHCHHGSRSAKAVLFLESVGFTNVTNLKGGIDSWSEEIDSNVLKY
ncbi:hypothetical protein J4476_04205 [Candidatus Woesearchaeota archaeon]|nr:MAG: adenylyltransferase and sulfurtransferase [archaeon GW2011_AR18]MBS3161866.1 hypothetical protein [Candidatus Woesearchaeota archaeon]HIH25600.1 hypothetical protein [Nanoarchaeota archaeon]